MLSLNSFLLFSQNPSALVDFYKKVFQSDPKWTGGDFKGFQIGSGSLFIGPHDKVHGKNMNPERMMFNIETEDVQGEFERVKQLGATVVQNPYHPDEDKKMTLATLTDPDGNYFQLASPMGM